MKLSVLLCTYNRPNDLLDKALRSIVIGSDEKPDEVIVVNGGTDDADRIVLSYTDRPDVTVRLVKTVNRNLAASRNVGLAHCTGDIVAMTDDDAEVFPDWVGRMKQAHMDHPEAGAVGGVVIGSNSDTLTGKVADAITFPAWRGAQYVRTLPGVNVSYKLEAAQKIGPQDETLFRGEDVDYNWRIKKLGYEIYFDPDIKVYHYHRPTLRGLLNQHYMYGRAYYLVRRKWPEMYCIYPHHIRRGKDVLKAINVVAALLYQPVILSRKMPSLATGAASIPILTMVGVAWRAGMLTQFRLERRAARQRS